MFRQKIPKSQQPDPNALLIHDFHSPHLVENRKWEGPYYRIVSIDPGRVNFAFRIEKRYLSGYPIETEVFVKIDLGDISVMCGNLTTFLDTYAHIYDTVHIFMIEKQLYVSYKALRVSQHAITYFMLKTKDKPLLPVIMDVDPKLKSRILDAPPYLNSTGLKKWAIDEAINLLTIRDDQKGLEIMRSATASKKDDLADTVVQCEAVCRYLGYGKTSPRPRLMIEIVQKRGPTIKIIQ